MKSLLCFLSLFCIISFFNTHAQESSFVNFFQMEPLDDSLFTSIQQQVHIDPTDPKAEIIVDARDLNNATVYIKGVLYPFLAFNPETRSRMLTYPYKIDLEDQIDYSSVFDRVINQINISKVLSPPTLHQISPSLSYINPFIQIFGGERFGASLKKDIGLSFGFGTPYSGPFETNFIEAGFNIVGFSAGVYSTISELVEPKDFKNYNNLYAGSGVQLGYTIPFGNFFHIGYIKSFADVTEHKKQQYSHGNDSTYHIKTIEGSYFNWELRYPVSLFGSTWSKFYAARYLNEYHIGFSGRELSVAGSTFDFRLDAMPKSDVRKPQVVIDLLVQKMFDTWAFSSLALGPSVIFTEAPDGHLTVSSLMLNFRFKLGTSY